MNALDEVLAAYRLTASVAQAGDMFGVKTEPACASTCPRARRRAHADRHANETHRRACEEVARLRESALDWDAAKKHFDSVFQQYKCFLGQTGTNTLPALNLTLMPLLRRYENGERTQELYEAMLAVE